MNYKSSEREISTKDWLLGYADVEINEETQNLAAGVAEELCFDDYDDDEFIPQICSLPDGEMVFEWEKNEREAVLMMKDKSLFWVVDVEGEASRSLGRAKREEKLPEEFMMLLKPFLEDS